MLDFLKKNRSADSISPKPWPQHPGLPTGQAQPHGAGAGQAGSLQTASPQPSVAPATLEGPPARPAAAPVAAPMPSPTAAMPRQTGVSNYNKLLNFVLLAVTFLLPLMFLPFTSEIREFNKQALVFFGVVVMLGAWMIKILTTRSVSWVKTSLDYILLAYLLIHLLAALFSIDKVSSFLGYYGRFTGSFISVLSLIVLYFLIVNNVRSEKTLKKLANWLLASSGIVVVFSLLQLLGLYILPLNFAQERSFNPVGSMVSLSIFTAIALIFMQWYLLVNQGLPRVKKILLGVLTVAGLLVMLLVNGFVGWLVLTLGLIAFLALGLVLTSEQHQSSSWFWKPMLVLVVSVVFTAFHFLPNIVNPRNLIDIQLPVEIQLSNATTWNMVGNSLAERPILGSGPGTTGIVFGDIKPEALNKTVVWSLNFDRASTELANIIIETGLLGLVAFELAAVLFLIYGLFFLLKKVSHKGRMQAFGFFIVWLTLYITHFFYFFNTTFYFLYWFSLAAFMAVAHWSDESSSSSSSLSFSNSPRSALSWMFASLLVLAVLLVGVFFEAAVYAAETSYVSGIKTLNQQQPNFNEVSSKFGRALTLNPYRDVYYLAYGQNLIFQASEEAAKQEPNVQQIQTWMADLINAGKAATDISPSKAANWSALAQFYTGIRPLVANTDDAILDSWTKAIERDSKNPSLLVSRARAYAAASEYIDEQTIKGETDTDGDGLADQHEQALGSNPQASDSNSNGVSDGDEVKAGFNPAGSGRLTAAQLAAFTKVDQSKLIEAEKDLRRAIELKPDLPDPYIELARILERSNRLADAKKQLDEAFKLFPSNADIRFEQGRIAFNQRNFAEAETIFLDVVRAVPNHANAHYSLGLVYQQKGDKAKALAEFEKVRELTGPNIDLDKLINDLKTALTAPPPAPAPAPRPAPQPAPAP